MSAAFDWVFRGRCYKLGHDVPHMGGVVPMRIVTEQRHDPKDIIPHLFAEIDPGFHERCARGDIIVAGHNFGMGAKMQGYIAMQALGLGLVCESMSFLGYREAIGVGLPVLTDCAGVTTLCESGDRLAVDFASGRFTNETRGVIRDFAPVPEALREVIALGGTTNWLREWWAKQRAATNA